MASTRDDFAIQLSVLDTVCVACVIALHVCVHSTTYLAYLRRDSVLSCCLVVLSVLPVLPEALCPFFGMSISFGYSGNKQTCDANPWVPFQYAIHYTKDTGEGTAFIEVI